MAIDWLDRPWRLAATAIAFPLIFLGGAIMALTAFPIIHIITPPGERGRERCQAVIRALFRGYVRLLLLLRLIDLEIEGANKLDDGVPRVIVANHPSQLDVVLLMALVRRAQCVVKRELWESPFFGRVVRGAGYIRNDLEGEAMIAACRASLDAGSSIIIFPEGTRTVPGQPVRLRRGFANIAMLLGAEIQIVTISCTPPTLLKGDRWWDIPPRRPVFRVDVGDRLDTAGRLESTYRSKAARKLVRDLEAYYAGRLAGEGL